jgi:calcineurin-like phosphoesterase family protein
MIWLTSDTHFGHENIIEYCKRPFRNAQKMDQNLIYNYRKVVKSEDTVIFAGDFTIKGPTYKGYLEHIVSQLPGTKILVLGNHDKFDPFIYVEVGFRSVHTAYEMEDFVVFHDPVGSLVNPNKLWLCGHVHILWKTLKNIYNVGVDQHGYFPVSMEEIDKWRRSLQL